jgi:predicted CXXCH cytochrome family protein
MFTTLQGKRLSIPRAISLTAGVALLGAAQIAGAGFTISPAPLQSTGPCLFSEQLQTSAPVRREYMAKLVAAVGGTGQASNSIEQMYGDIKKASYSEAASDHAEPALNIWGFENKHATHTPGIDTLSADCLSCHDGVGATPVTTVLRNDPMRSSRHPLPSSDHPIGMDYNRYVASREGYKSLFGVSNKMVFVDGKVGCLTCHDPLNPEKGHLVMSDRNSALCLTCHNK